MKRQTAFPGCHFQPYDWITCFRATAISKERLRNAYLTKKWCGLALELGSVAAKNHSSFSMTHYKSLGKTWSSSTFECIIWLWVTRMGQFGYIYSSMKLHSTKIIEWYSVSPNTKLWMPQVRHQKSLLRNLFFVSHIISGNLGITSFPCLGMSLWVLD